MSFELAATKLSRTPLATHPQKQDSLSPPSLLFQAFVSPKSFAFPGTASQSH